jgi:hypothetical protein
VDDAALTQFLDAAFDYLCTRRVGELIDADRLMAAVDTATAPERTTRFIGRFIAPARARLLARARESKLLLGVWLPAPAKEALAQMLGTPAPIPREIIDEIVHSEKVRHDVREMLLESISNVVTKAFSVAPGGKAARGVLGFGARAAGGLFNIEDRLKDVVDVGVAIVLKRLGEDLRSEDTARLIGKQRRRGFLALLGRSEAEAARFLDRIPHAILDALAPGLLAHNLARTEVREAVRVEILAALAELDTQTIGELLEEAGLRQTIRDWIHDRVQPLAQEFLAKRN